MLGPGRVLNTSAREPTEGSGFVGTKSEMPGCFTCADRKKRCPRRYDSEGKCWDCARLHLRCLSNEDGKKMTPSQLLNFQDERKRAAKETRRPHNRNGSAALEPQMPTFNPTRQYVHQQNAGEQVLPSGASGATSYLAAQTHGTHNLSETGFNRFGSAEVSTENAGGMEFAAHPPPQVIPEHFSPAFAFPPVSDRGTNYGYSLFPTGDGELGRRRDLSRFKSLPAKSISKFHPG
ncbi:uncharacterized protein EI90DRAFT_3287201 [Cantharellus anzutake]|uniref:uncharacterized protein n=1 Tax=Cantharellus anzutake TaxID=1750568 RepID=UPI0019035237|nr:uncharacterized protein EI90DRAFT_3287201 [Cantharellus anzutake]KAF8336821.1 hypothetical protein EI90DRAFT_3287201 [Cantharellus anzutake]